jgi:hypothetical protein
MENQRLRSQTTGEPAEGALTADGSHGLSDAARMVVETADYGFALMALALAKISVHEANADTEDAIAYTRSRLRTQYPSRKRLPATLQA